jgi:hypothetical protein
LILYRPSAFNENGWVILYIQSLEGYLAKFLSFI